MVQIYASLPVQCSIFFYFFCMRLDAMYFMGGKNVRKVILFFAFSTAISVLLQETLAVTSQQLSCNVLNVSRYGF